MRSVIFLLLLLALSVAHTGGRETESVTDEICLKVAIARDCLTAAMAHLKTDCAHMTTLEKDNIAAAYVTCRARQQNIIVPFTCWNGLSWWKSCTPALRGYRPLKTQFSVVSKRINDMCFLYIQSKNKKHYIELEDFIGLSFP